MDSIKLKVRSAADMVTVVPFLIGFHPGDGNLVVVVCAGGRVVFAARADLPEPGSPEAAVRGLADHLIPVVGRQQPISAVVLIGYGDAGQVDPALHVVAEAFTVSDLPVRDLLRVTAGRFFSLTCTNQACCPPQGTPYDPTVSLIAVNATVAGAVALPDRAAVAARFAPVEGAAREGMCNATLAALGRLDVLSEEDSDAVDEAGATAVREALRTHDGGGCLPDDEMAWLTLLLNYDSVWDLAMKLTEPHDRHVTFWAEVTRRAEEPLAPAPATLLALTAWRCGDGALATMAAERALQVDPEDRFAGLLLRAIQAGVAPSVVELALRGSERRPDERLAPGQPQDTSTDPAPNDIADHGTARHTPYQPQISVSPQTPAEQE